MLQGIIIGVCVAVAVLLIGAMVFTVVQEETRYRRYYKAMAKFNERYWKEYEDAQG